MEEIIAFLNEIGIKTSRGNVPSNSFMPNIAIQDGSIIYNKDATLGDLLHEAGHLAIIPKKYRPMCQGDMDESMRAIFDKAEIAGEMIPDSTIYCALIQSSDPEATAWAWSAGRHIGIEPQDIIADYLYEGTGADVRLMLSLNCYLGINGLRAAGMLTSVKSFPHLTQWTQP